MFIPGKNSRVYPTTSSYVQSLTMTSLRRILGDERDCPNVLCNARCLKCCGERPRYASYLRVSENHIPANVALTTSANIFSPYPSATRFKTLNFFSTCSLFIVPTHSSAPTMFHKIIQPYHLTLLANQVLHLPLSDY